jgi:F0F1-type ATP synthase membrane subunit b/b'
MERRQIIALAIVIILVVFLKLANDFQVSKTKSQTVTKKTKITKNKGQVKGVVEQLDSGLKYVEERAGNVIQDATEYVIEQASSSANALTNQVIKNTTQNILNQIEKLPESQQNAVKEVICK